MKRYKVKYLVYGKEYETILQGENKRELYQYCSMWTNWDKVIAIDEIKEEITMEKKDFKHYTLEQVLAIIDQKVEGLDYTIEKYADTPTDKLILKSIRDDICRHTSEFVHLIHVIEDGYFD